MTIGLPAACRAVLDEQAGVISYRQALASGLTVAVVDNQLRSGRWQPLQRGVYATFTGPPARRRSCGRSSCGPAPERC